VSISLFNLFDGSVNELPAVDPAGLYTPAEYVNLQLESPEVQKFLKTLSPEDAQHYEFLSSQLSQPNGHSNPAALNDIGEFLEQRGVYLSLPDELFEPPATQDSEYTSEPGMLSSSLSMVLWFKSMFFSNMVELHEISWEDPETKKMQVFRSVVDIIPTLDVREIFHIPGTKYNPYSAKITTYNGIAVFNNDPPVRKADKGDANAPPVFRKTAPAGPLLTMSRSQTDRFYTSVLLSRRVVHQTGKGKVRSHWYLVLMGNGDGLIGYGQGKHLKPRIALQQARASAIRNMDTVERFESRTVWTDMTAKLGATRLLLRPRPVGFGLRCNPYLHQVLRAAGFKDISAKVWGSRNKMNVIKCAFMLLQAGHAPPGMGNGVGGKGVKLSRGVGMMGKSDMERARGRKLISLRK